MPSPEALGDASSAAGRKRYPSPLKYQDHPLAQKLNAVLDKADLSQPGDMLSKPAETCMVGECALATGEAMGLTGEGDEVPVHPAWLLLCAFVAYAVIIGAQHWLLAKKGTTTPADPAEAEARRAGLD